MWVLWNRVGLLRVGGVEVWGLLKSGSLFVWVMWVRGFFEHPQGSEAKFRRIHKLDGLHRSYLELSTERLGSGEWGV